MNNDNQPPIEQDILLVEDDDRSTVTVHTADEIDTEDEWDEWELEEEDARGCERCSGCAYCQDDGGYNPSDEI